MTGDAKATVDLAAALNRLGMSGVEFARYIGMRPETVSRWVNGHRQAPEVVYRLLTWMVKYGAQEGLADER